MLVRREVESHNRVDAAETKARVLMDQAPSLEAQIKELETEFESS